MRTLLAIQSNDLMSIVNLNLPNLLDIQNLLYSDLPNYLDLGPPRQGGQEGLNGTRYPGGLNRLPYLENFHFSNLLAASEAGC